MYLNILKLDNIPFNQQTTASHSFVSLTLNIT